MEVEEMRLLRLPQVMAITTLSRADIYRKIQAGTFPKQIRISHKRAAWRAKEVREWLEKLEAA